MSRVPLAVAAGLLVVLAVGFWLSSGGLFLASGSCSEEERKRYTRSFRSTVA